MRRVIGRFAASRGGRGAGAGPGLDRQPAADQEGALAHAADAEPALGVVEGEAAAVVGDVSSTPPSSAAQAYRDAAGAGVAGGVVERLLGDPVDDQLRVVAEVGEVTLARR